MVPKIKSFFETCWSAGRHALSGSNRGRAPSLRRWMAADLGGVAPDAPVVEAGCGDASFTGDLARCSNFLMAIGISDGGAEKNSSSLTDINFLQHDVAERLPFADDAFEVV